MATATRKKKRTPAVSGKQAVKANIKYEITAKVKSR